MSRENINLIKMTQNKIRENFRLFIKYKKVIKNVDYHKLIMSNFDN